VVDVVGETPDTEGPGRVPPVARFGTCGLASRGKLTS
jgi:hypothetical protein